MSAASISSNKIKVYLDKPYVKVLWDTEDGILMSRWSGFCTFDEIKAVSVRILDAVVLEGAKKVLYDAREIEVLDDESQEYISGAFTREMIQSGIMYSATVFPDDVFAKFSVDDIHKSLKGRKISNVTYFQSLPSAIEWLKSK
ncbi:hypothetical protein N6H18_12335 [Reichenbachiella agarivorans]|uniref:SpoIIAA-like n=1 Tax=Reichenbachiella agarivorans TaxID=2979464 RepID=A0ABY6CKX4_9BACT|nr:hypothetical protein [Reichenbachiella agarivorans]UXP31137.1 hypothetical protein N6H18_12335 [Reichenbachiella agarivorans]